MSLKLPRALNRRETLAACVLYPAFAYGTVRFAYLLYRQGADYDTIFVTCVVVAHAFFGALVYRWWAFALPLAFYFIWSTQVPCGEDDLACVVLAVSGVIGAVSVVGATVLRWLITTWLDGTWFEANRDQVSKPPE